jgi:DTW domain-containing protein YfiP
VQAVSRIILLAIDREMDRTIRCSSVIEHNLSQIFVFDWVRRHAEGYFLDDFIPLMRTVVFTFYPEERRCLSLTDHPSPFGAAPLGERATASQYGY